MAGKNRDATPDPVIDSEPDPQLELELGGAADREHGMKTRARSKQIVSGRPYAS